MIKLFVLTMPPNRAKYSVSKSLDNIGFPTYVHTINNLSKTVGYQITHDLTSVNTDFSVKRVQ